MQKVYFSLQVFVLFVVLIPRMQEGVQRFFVGAPSMSIQFVNLAIVCSVKYELVLGKFGIFCSCMENRVINIAISFGMSCILFFKIMTVVLLQAMLTKLIDMKTNQEVLISLGVGKKFSLGSTLSIYRTYISIVHVGQITWNIKILSWNNLTELMLPQLGLIIFHARLSEIFRLLFRIMRPSGFRLIFHRLQSSGPTKLKLGVCIKEQVSCVNIRI